MNYILCRNRVRNFDYWKGVFDSHAADHRAAGLKLVHLWYELTSPRNVFFLFEAEDIERARAFLDSVDGSASGVIEGGVLLFSESLSYGLLNEAESRAFAAAMEGASATNNSVPEPVNRAEREQSAEPGKSPDTEKSTAPAKSPTPSASATTAAPTSTEPKTMEPANSSIAQATMKGPERAKNAPPLEVVDGWQPVENWPPAEAAAEVASEPPQRRGGWMRKKY